MAAWRRLTTLLRAVALPLMVGGLVRAGANLSLVPCFSHPSRFLNMFAFASTAIVSVILLMLQVSWCASLAMDPGKLDREIARRGSDRISHYPRCMKCGLPKPPRCHHCSKCGGCILFMDHHCLLIDNCLGYRNFKCFILVFFYGAAASAWGSLVIFVSIFLDLKQSRAVQFGIVLLLAAIAAGLMAFANIYLRLKRSNLTTIEEMFNTNPADWILPNAPVFESGFLKFLPLPSRLDPFEIIDELTCLVKESASQRV
jgi:hypothetical protein